MQKILLLIILFFPVSGGADWELRQADDGHWITTVSPEGHELIVAHNEAQETHFLLVLALNKQAPEVPSRISLTVDSGPPAQVELTLLEQRHNNRLFRIEIDNAQKAQYIKRMIAGLNMRIWFGESVAAHQSLQFSMLGFTAAFNDLLIADRVGRLDPVWLIERGREKELGCLYTANLFVQAMLLRIEHHGAEYTRNNLPLTGYKAVDDMIPDIVSQVYAIPVTQLPIEPRGEKYAIFKTCMGG